MDATDGEMGRDGDGGGVGGLTLKYPPTEAEVRCIYCCSRIG